MKNSKYFIEILSDIKIENTVKLSFGDSSRYGR
jgi:hypothetical protein